MAIQLHPISPDSREERLANFLNQANSDISLADCWSKYRRMSAAPLAFFRGSNGLFWSDVADSRRRSLADFSDDDCQTWLQGDLHPYNFGAYDDDSRHLVYGLNDFDDSLIGDYQFDVLRLASGIVLAFDQNDTLTGDDRRIGVQAFASAYLREMRRYAEGRRADRRCYTVKRVSPTVRLFLELVKRDKSRKSLLERWASGRKLKPDHPGLSPAEPEEVEALQAAIPSYLATRPNKSTARELKFELLDVARRQGAGTGSLGRRRFYLLVCTQRRDGKPKRRILDVKHQHAPAGLPFVGADLQTAYEHEYGDNHALRHAQAYRALIRHADDFLGWLQLQDAFFSVREVSPFKEAFPTEVAWTRELVKEVSRLWGRILATNHTLGSQRVARGFPQRIRAITKQREREFVDHVAEFATWYAKVVEEDHALLVRMVDQLALDGLHAATGS